jgi:NADPH:quinone reductase-like Zn-dependent oxidoreductase
VRAAVLESYDRPPQPGEFDEPAGGEGVIVDVAVAGLNPIDLVTAAGQLPDKPPLPSVAGKEGVGRFDGRRVYFDAPIAPYGSIAERAPVREDRLIDVPDGVDDGLAVSFGIAGLAAWLGLEWRGQIQQGETVLVLGASGVVGQVAVQAARLLGARRVIAASRSVDRLDALGADAVVPLGDDENLVDRFREAADGDLHLVIDPVWGPTAVAAIEALAPFGRLVQIGNSAGASTEVPARVIRNPVKAVLGHTNRLAPQEVKAQAFQAMCRHAAAGELSVPVEETPLDAISETWARQAEGPHVKLVVRL